MASQRFVVNEWIFHDLSGENGWEAQDETFRFLQRVKERCDTIAVLRGSRWTEKAFELMTLSEQTARRLSKFLHLEILQNSKKCQYIDPGQIKGLPQDILANIPADDAYLFELYHSVGADVLVTTDEHLVQAASSLPDFDFTIRLRAAFVPEYLRSNQ